MAVEKSPQESRLFEMLADMAKDRSLLERFEGDDRSSVMEEYNLSEEQKELLNAAIEASDDREESYRLVGKLIGDHAETFLIPFC